MTPKDLVLGMQLEALADADFNDLNGYRIAEVLRAHRDCWSMLYFGGDDLIVFPAPGKDDELAKLFLFDRDDEASTAKIRPDDVRWDEVEGKRYIWAWWD